MVLSLTHYKKQWPSLPQSISWTVSPPGQRAQRLTGRGVQKLWVCMVNDNTGTMQGADHLYLGLYDSGRTYFGGLGVGPSWKGKGHWLEYRELKSLSTSGISGAGRMVSYWEKGSHLSKATWYCAGRHTMCVCSLATEGRHTMCVCSPATEGRPPLHAELTRLSSQLYTLTLITRVSPQKSQ